MAERWCPRLGEMRDPDACGFCRGDCPRDAGRRLTKPVTRGYSFVMSKRTKPSVLLTVSLPPDLCADVKTLAKEAGENVSAFVQRSLMQSPRLVAYRMGREYKRIVEGKEKDVDGAIARMVGVLSPVLPACDTATKLEAELRRFQELRRKHARQEMTRSGIGELVK